MFMVFGFRVSFGAQQGLFHTRQIPVFTSDFHERNHFVEFFQSQGRYFILIKSADGVEWKQYNWGPPPSWFDSSGRRELQESLINLCILCSGRTENFSTDGFILLHPTYVFSFSGRLQTTGITVKSIVSMAIPSDQREMLDSMIIQLRSSGRGRTYRRYPHLVFDSPVVK